MPWTGGSTRQWRKDRAAVLERDAWQCRLQISGICQGRADTVHHLYGKTQDRSPLEDLVAACKPCNQRIGDPTRGRAQPVTAPADPEPLQRTRW